VAIAALAGAGEARAAAGMARVGEARATAGAVEARAAAGYSFAPYLDLTDYPTPDLAAIRRASGVDQTTLAFVTARGTTACSPSWGGYPADPASGPSAFERGAIAAFRRGGGQVVISLGGQAGAELASTCKTVMALTRAYRSVIAAYHPSRLDFDIEGAAVADASSIDRRSQALAALQKAARARHRTLRISLTLPVLPTGLDPDGLRVVRSAVAHHVTLTYVNVMTMDYGDAAAPHPNGQMARYAIRAAGDVRRQLHAVQPRLCTAAHLGLTPMIGINDVSTETFTLTDAQTLAAYARTNHVGLLSMWQLGRDRQCAQPTSSTQIACSSVNQAPYAFSHALEP
jgi:hypothetical protein